MADSAIAVGAGGGGAGGGGIAFNTPRDIFNGATRAAAEALRDSTITDTAPWDDDPILGIILTWPVVVTDTIYQVRRSGQWVDVDVLVEGDDGNDGSTGPAGPQSRMVLYAYINTATAPTAAPTGGTFIQSTGVKTVPTGYTAAPVTPPTGQETYRAEAIVNPAVDVGTVNLVWSIPTLLPAYAAATLAEDFADDAAAARDLAQQYAGQAQDIPAGSPRGALVATSPTLPTAATGTNTVIAFGAAELWTIDANAPDGYEAGPAASNERLYLPDIHPAGSNGMFIVVEVDGVEIAEVFVSQGGIQGATGADRRHILPVSLTADALVRVGFWPRSGATASYVQITGNSDTLPANTVVKVYLAVVRGTGGGGGGGGVGPPGPAGPAGADGTDGTDGADGAAGPAGAAGAAGAAGMDGADGATGPAGADGADGADGAGAAPAQDEGTVVVATPSAYNFVGDGVVVTNVGGVATVTIVGGGGVPSTHTSQYLALKATDDPTAADFEGANGVAFATGTHTAMAPNTPAGNVYLLLWRIDTDPEPVFLDVNNSGLNQFGAVTKQVATLDLTNGDTGEVWVSENALPYQAASVEFR